jgi:16S rRNA U516 pseudouridylate synthase RsuA-like enzyme
MRKQTLLLIGALAALGACSRTEDGDLVVKKPVDVDVQTQQDTLHTPKVTTRTDTINTPVVGTQKETLIVNKPVVGTKKTEVKVPVIKKP